MNNSGKIEEFKLNYGTVLEFATGAPYPPPSGFVSPPTITFQDMNPSVASQQVGIVVFDLGALGGSVCLLHGLWTS